MEFAAAIIVLAAVVLIYFFIRNKDKSGKGSNLFRFDHDDSQAIEFEIAGACKNEETEGNASEKENNIYPYKRRELFTLGQWRLYSILKDFAEQNGFIVFTKQRLSDFIEVDAEKTYDIKQYASRLSTLKVDFLLCEEESMLPLAAVNQQNGDNQKEIEEILKSVGIAFNTSDSFKELKEELLSFKRGITENSAVSKQK